MASQPVFIQVGELAEGCAPDSSILPALNDLVSRILQLHGADGRYRFQKTTARNIGGRAHSPVEGATRRVPCGTRRFSLYHPSS